MLPSMQIVLGLLLAVTAPATVFAISPATPPSGLKPVTVVADFSTWIDNPLVKDKIGVYQTPFLGTVGRPPLAAMQPFLKEAGVRDLRYETGWGKPDTYAFDQIRGSAKEPTVDFSRFDPFMTMLHNDHVQPLLAVGYDPLPLETCASPNCWKHPPSSSDGWSAVLRQVSRHYAQALGIGGVQYEIWNEPDISAHGGKIFFTGNQADYGVVYRSGAAGIQAGSGRDALVGGPVIAYDTSYLTRSGMLLQPFDFLSIHGYANYPVQIAHLRAASQDHGPLYLTEYASYATFGIRQPISRHGGAQKFMADAAMMMNDPDVAKVYWAQWIDDSLGMITYGLHRKAIFNAYKIYETMLPVDRAETTISDAGSGVGAMAGKDAHTTGIAVWNASAFPKKVTVRLGNLPFATGKLTQWFVDSRHASYEDGAPEMLTSGGDFSTAVRGAKAVWSGTIQAQSLVYVQASDGSPSLLANHRIGVYGGDHYYFSSRPGTAYADFDPATSIARLGMGAAATGTAVVGNVYDAAGSGARLHAEVTRSGPFQSSGVNAIFGVRVDYMNRSGKYSRAVLYTSGLHSAAPTLALPWGTGRAVPEAVHTFHGSSFTLDLAADAPADWNGSRVIVTPMLGDAGAHSRARIVFTAAP